MNIKPANSSNNNDSDESPPDVNSGSNPPPKPPEASVYQPSQPSVTPSHSASVNPETASYQRPSTQPEPLGGHVSAANHTKSNNDSQDDSSSSLFPQAVVKIFTSRGIEYLFLLVALLVLTFAIFVIGEDLISYFFGDRDGSFYSSGVLSVDVAAVISLGALAFFAKRLTTAEQMSSKLLDDPSRKRVTQIGLRVAYAVLLYVIGLFIYRLLRYPETKLGLVGDSEVGIGEILVVSMFQLVVSVVLFWYLWRADRGSGLNFKLHTFALAGLAVLVVALVGMQYTLPEAFRRDVRADRQISSDLEDIRDEIERYQREESELPEDIEDLEPKPVLERRAEAFNYSYKPGSGRSYELCATFNLDGDEIEDQYAVFEGLFGAETTDSSFGSGNSDIYSPRDTVDFDEHDKGEECFELGSTSTPTPTITPYNFDSFDSDALRRSLQQ
jgi:hypothetical protein